MKIQSLIVSLLCFIGLTGCSNETQLQAWRLIETQNALLVDVRTPAEFRSGHVPGATLIPVDQVSRRLNEFGTDKTRPIVVYCRSGSRSGSAEKYLKEQGFTTVLNGGGYRALMNAKQEYAASKS